MKLTFKTPTLIFVLCFLFQNSYSQQNMSGWQWINSRPQSNDLKWVKIIDASHYYAVGQYGTFMKSTDAGDNWIINSQAGVSDPTWGSGSSFNLNTAWFFNANTGIVAGQSLSGDGGKIRRTTDGGMTFSSITLGASGTSSVNDIYFINSTTGYLCGNNSAKAMKTTNAGLNWTLLPNLPSYLNSYKCIFATDENNIMLGIDYNLDRKILRTTNAGVTWNELTMPGSNGVGINDIKFLNAGTGFIAGRSNPNYLAYTTNGGANWTEKIFPNRQYPIQELQVIGSTVYALGASFKSYHYSSNLGVTWDSVTFDDQTNPAQPDPFFIYSFNINGNDAIVVGANGKTNISNDGGASWRNKNYSVEGEYSYSTIYAQPGTGNIWAGADWGGFILYSSNRGANWTKQQTTAGYAFYDIDMVNSNTGYAVGGNLFNGKGYCYKTVNGGLNWAPLTIASPGVQRNAVDFTDANTGWIVGGLPSNGGSLISKTTNGGATWVEQTVSGFNSVIGEVKMFDKNIGYIAGGPNVWKTTNGGNNWNNINAITPYFGQSIKVFSNNTLYFGSAQTIYKSFDGGATWSSAQIPSTIANIFDMDWTDLNNGTVVGTQGYSAKTTDGGLTWTERNTGSSTLWGISMPHKDTVFASCGINVYGAIFKLCDVNNSISINIKAGIEGFWNGTSQVQDTITVSLRSPVYPYNVIGQNKTVINSLGTGTVSFNAVPPGNYYIQINQRNSIETWSSTPIALGSNLNVFDFTTAATQAYGNNMVLSLGRYCIYEGDVNQEGTVNLTDVIQIYNASSIFSSGYVSEDVNGNNIVDLTDMIIAFNNSSDFVREITPINP